MTTASGLGQAAPPQPRGLLYRDGGKSPGALPDPGEDLLSQIHFLADQHILSAHTRRIPKDHEV